MLSHEFIEWRKGRKLTQAAAGRLLGVSLPAITRYEAPEGHKLHVPVPKPIEKLIAALETKK